MNQDINNLNNGSLIKILSSNFIIRHRVKILCSFIIIAILLLFCNLLYTIYLMKSQKNIENTNVIFKNNICDSYYFEQTINLLTEADRKKLLDNIDKKPLNKKISKLLEDHDFNVTLKSLTEDGIIELLTYLVDKNHDIHDNILELLTNSYFNQTLSVFPDDAIIKLIKSLVEKKTDIHPNILILLKTYCFNETLAKLKNNGIELINYLIEKEDDIDKSIANLFGGHIGGDDFYKILTLLPYDEFNKLVENLIKNNNIIGRNIVNLLQKHDPIIYLLLRFSKEDRSNFLNDLLIKNIKDNIFYFLTSYNFPKILDLLSDDNTKTLFNDLINREVDIHPDILKLLSNDVFYKIIESLPEDDRIKTINKLLDKEIDINKNAIGLLSNFDKTIISYLGDKFLDIFDFCIDPKKDIQNSNITKEWPHEIFKIKNITFNRILKSILVDDCISLIKSIINNIDSIKQSNLDILIKAANDPNKPLTVDEIYNILGISCATQAEVNTVSAVNQTPKILHEKSS